MTGVDRITELHVQGMRAIEDVRLPLNGLTVLIGDNGTGKSTLLEALELLRKAAIPSRFVHEGLPSHGITTLFRAASAELRLGARIEGDGETFEYSFALGRDGRDVFVASETLDVLTPNRDGEPLRLLDRNASGVQVLDPSKGHATIRVPSAQLALPTFGAVTRPEYGRVLEALSAARVHVPFDVSPRWVDGKLSAIREPSLVGSASELFRLGGNLANCFHTLANDRPHGVWERTMEKVRAALPDVTRIRMPAAMSGQVEMVFERRFGDELPASALSDGQLTYLAFVALCELGTSASVLGFDEPETHLHPELLVRVVWLFEELARSCPVLLVTHSDRLLDALSDPSKVVLCEQGEAGATRLSRPDPAALEQWMKRYRGLGDLRAAGFVPHVMKRGV